MQEVPTQDIPRTFPQIRAWRVSIKEWWNRATFHSKERLAKASKGGSGAAHITILLLYGIRMRGWMGSIGAMSNDGEFVSPQGSLSA